MGIIFVLFVFPVPRMIAFWASKICLIKQVLKIFAFLFIQVLLISYITPK